MTGPLLLLLTALGAGTANPRIVSITTSSAAARAEFIRGRDLMDDLLWLDALPHFKKALALDPHFALAMTYVGQISSGPEGLAELQRAAELATTLPDAERHFIELWLANGQGETVKADRLVRSLVQEAPDDWRVMFEFGAVASRHHDWEGAVAAYERALVIADEPHRRCSAYNDLGYAEAHRGRYDLALAALKRCTTLQPNAHNAFDSVGEIELAANRLSEADAAFHEALAKRPDYWPAWQGIAVVNFAEGDWERGYAALAKGQDAARADILAWVRLHLDFVRAWGLFTEGKTSQALQKLDALEAAAKAAKGQGRYSFALAALVRASMLNELGRYAEGLAAAKLCLERVQKSGLPGAASDMLRRRALRRQIWAEAKIASPGLDATLASIEQEAKANPDDFELQGSLHLGRAAVLLAHQQLVSAASELKQCRLDGIGGWFFEPNPGPEGDEYCVWQLALLQEQMGDHDAAAKTRELFGRGQGRDPVTLYIRSKVRRRF